MPQPEPISGLPDGAVFTTALTRRLGVILARTPDGVQVQLDRPDEEKTVHQRVLVYWGNHR